MSIVRQITDGEVAAVLAQLAASGGTARSPESWKQDRMTALVLAGEGGGAPQAIMPVAQRDIQVSPGRMLHAGWLSSNQFASRMLWRRQTRGTATEWARLLPETDALFVTRREEASLGPWAGSGRWYGQTGFSDVLAVRCLYLDMEAPPSIPGAGGAIQSAPEGGRYHAQVVTPVAGQWDAETWQPQMLAVYRDVFGACGGAPIRSAEFWAPALANHYYGEHYQFQIIGLWSPPAPSPSPSAGAIDSRAAAATLMGYAVVGWSGWHSKRPRMDILELATRQWDTAIAGDLIRTTCQLAWSKNVRQVRAVISVHDPYRGHLARTGFADRWGYVMMAKWLHAQRYLDRLSEMLPRELGDFWVQLMMPGEVPLVLGRGTRSSPAGSVNLQGDARTITRLLLNRTDISAALQEGTLVSADPVSDRDLARLSICFPWTPWVFHMLDYI